MDVLLSCVPAWVARWPLPPALRACIAHVLRSGPVPRHIAIIMDGNRRFARQNHVVTIQGHAAGFDKLKETLEWCLGLGVDTVTVYAFSIENFKRSPEEVDGLMALAKEKFAQMLDKSCVVFFVWVVFVLAVQFLTGAAET
jgi:ditrans,polycis-polyprenyl diphosphate synthase